MLNRFQVKLVFRIRGFAVIKYLYVDEGKTSNSTRSVPVHQHLLDLGIEEALKKGIHSYGYSAIKTCFTSIMERKAIPRLNQKGEFRSFHSIRHSFNTHIDYEPLMERIMGRSRNLGTSDRYIHGAKDTLKRKQEVVNSVNYLNK